MYKKGRFLLKKSAFSINGDDSNGDGDSNDGDDAQLQPAVAAVAAHVNEYVAMADAVDVAAVAATAP